MRQPSPRRPAGRIALLSDDAMWARSAHVRSCPPTLGGAPPAGTPARELRPVARADSVPLRPGPALFGSGITVVTPIQASCGFRLCQIIATSSTEISVVADDLTSISRRISQRRAIIARCIRVWIVSRSAWRSTSCGIRPRHREPFRQQKTSYVTTNLKIDVSLLVTA
jgi:hypothetical protein